MIGLYVNPRGTGLAEAYLTTSFTTWLPLETYMFP